MMKCKALLVGLFFGTNLIAQVSTFTGNEEVDLNATTDATYGSSITASEEGGFFIVPNADVYPYNSNNNNNDLYYCFPSDPKYTDGNQYSAPFRVPIQKPSSLNPWSSFGSVIVEMGSHFLMVDTTGFPCNIYLYEKVSSPGATSWNFTGKVFVQNHMWQVGDVERISASEIAIADADTIFVMDFDPTQQNFLTIQQILENPLTDNYHRHGSTIEVVGDRIYFCNHGSYNTQLDSKDGVRVFERNGPGTNYSYVGGLDINKATQKIEFLEGYATDLFVVSEKWGSFYLYEYSQGQFTLHDSIVGYGRAGWGKNMDANHGKLLVNLPHDRTYASSNLSIGTARLYEPINTGSGWTLNWEATYLPIQGAVGDSSYLIGDVAIGERLMTNDPDSSNTYGIAYGAQLKQVGSTANAGSWYLVWNAGTALSSIEYSKVESSVFPIPAAELVTLQFSDDLTGEQIMLTDMSGKVILSESIEGTSHQITRNGLPAGTYLVHVVIDQQVVVEKIIFQ